MAFRPQRKKAAEHQRPGMTTVEREEPNNRVEGNVGTARDSAVLLGRFSLGSGGLRGLCGVLRFGHHFCLRLFECVSASGILRYERLRFFSHRHRRQDQRGQNESAGNTHTVGHLENLLAWQVLFGAGKDKVAGRWETA